MIEREKGKDHERVKEKTLGQPTAVKERKGGRMAASMRGQQRHVAMRVRGKGGYRKKPL
jgi:hypothetical protein